MLNRDYSEMLSLLNERQAEYLVVGAYALAAHGLPRATGDMDVFVNPTPANASKVRDALAAFGAPVAQLTEGDLATPGTVFQIGVAPCRIDIITRIDGVSWEKARADAVEREVDGLVVPFLGRASLIANKRATGRPRDREDADLLEREGGAR